MSPLGGHLFSILFHSKILIVHFKSSGESSLAVQAQT